MIRVWQDCGSEPGTSRGRESSQNSRAWHLAYGHYQGCSNGENIGVQL